MLDYDAGTLIVRGDSELMVKQANGTYRVRKPGLKAVEERATRRSGSSRVSRIEHVPRERNK